MKVADLTKPSPKPRSKRPWVAAPAAASLCALLLLSPRQAGERGPADAAGSGRAAPMALVPSSAAKTDWEKLSAADQRTLEPLKGSWSSMTAEQKSKWLLVVERFHGKPSSIQRRLTARMAEWAHLTPHQRARARLNFLTLAKHYNLQQRKEQWQAYLRAMPAQHRIVPSAGQPTGVPPAFALVSPGATTVQLSRLYELTTPDDLLQRGDAGRDPPAVDREAPQGEGPAASPAGRAAEPDHAAP